MKNNKVVYGWFSDGLPFYIGIGSVKRSRSKRGRNAYCSRKRAKAERENSFEIRILYCNLSWEQACEIEISLISLYGRVDLGTGILTNMTDGGEGVQGVIRSKETRKRMSKSKFKENNPNWGKSLSQNQKEKIRMKLKGRNHSQSAKERMSKSKLGIKNFNWGKSMSQEQKDKISKAQTGENHHNWGKSLSQTTREKISKSVSKPIMTSAGRFESSKEASLFHRICRQTLIRWLNDPNKPEFYRLTGEQND